MDCCHWAALQVLKAVQGRQFQPLWPSLSAHVFTEVKGMCETSFGTMLKGKVEKNTALEYFYCYVGINVVTKKKSALALIQWQAIQGSFQQHWTFHCFLYPNLCPKGIKVHPFFLFKLGYKVKLMQQRHSQYHELFFHLSSNVPLKQAQTFPSNA